MLGLEKQQNFITLTNDKPQTLAFKVQCTSPKLFKLKPAIGRVKAHQSQKISIQYLANKDNSVLECTFLVRTKVLQVAVKSNDEMKKYWLQSKKESEEQMLLVCTMRKGERSFGEVSSAVKQNSARDPMLVSENTKEILPNAAHIPALKLSKLQTVSTIVEKLKLETSGQNSAQTCPVAVEAIQVGDLHVKPSTDGEKKDKSVRSRLLTQTLMEPLCLTNNMKSSGHENIEFERSQVKHNEDSLGFVEPFEMIEYNAEKFIACENGLRMCILQLKTTITSAESSVCALRACANNKNVDDESNRCGVESLKMLEQFVHISANTLQVLEQQSYLWDSCISKPKVYAETSIESGTCTQNDKIIDPALTNSPPSLECDIVSSKLDVSSVQTTHVLDTNRCELHDKDAEILSDVSASDEISSLTVTDIVENFTIKEENDVELMPSENVNTIAPPLDSLEVPLSEATIGNTLHSKEDQACTSLVPEPQQKDADEEVATPQESEAQCDHPGQADNIQMESTSDIELDKKYDLNANQVNEEDVATTKEDHTLNVPVDTKSSTIPSQIPAEMENLSLNENASPIEDFPDIELHKVVSDESERTTTTNTLDADSTDCSDNINVVPERSANSIALSSKTNGDDHIASDTVIERKDGIGAETKAEMTIDSYTVHAHETKHGAANTSSPKKTNKVNELLKAFEKVDHTAELEKHTEVPVQAPSVAANLLKSNGNSSTSASTKTEKVKHVEINLEQIEEGIVRSEVADANTTETSITVTVPKLENASKTNTKSPSSTGSALSQYLKQCESASVSLTKQHQARLSSKALSMSTIATKLKQENSDDVPTIVNGNDTIIDTEKASEVVIENAALHIRCDKTVKVLCYLSGELPNSVVVETSKRISITKVGAQGKEVNELFHFDAVWETHELVHRRMRELLLNSQADARTTAFYYYGDLYNNSLIDAISNAEQIFSPILEEEHSVRFSAIELTAKGLVNHALPEKYATETSVITSRKDYACIIEALREKWNSSKEVAKSEIGNIRIVCIENTETDNPQKLLLVDLGIYRHTRNQKAMQTVKDILSPSTVDKVLKYPTCNFAPMVAPSIQPHTDQYFLVHVEPSSTSITSTANTMKFVQHFVNVRTKN